MSKTLDTAHLFFQACETGKGWSACEPYCLPDALFSCQSGALAEITTIAAYVEWMKGTHALMPDAVAEIKASAEDSAKACVLVFAVFTGTHTGEGGPVQPTGKSTQTDYCFAIRFHGDQISSVTKIWNDAFALTQLGWA